MKNLRLCLVLSTKDTSKTKTSMGWINTTAKETKQTKSFQIQCLQFLESITYLS